MEIPINKDNTGTATINYDKDSPLEVNPISQDGINFSVIKPSSETTEVLEKNFTTTRWSCGFNRTILLV